MSEQTEIDEKTKEVETLLGDPKKAILAIALPTAVALIAQSVNSLVDAAWVAGLGSDALTAVGIIFPIFFIVIGISNGIGVGAASAISKRIGAGNKTDADKTASHAIVLVILVSAIMTIIMMLVLEPMIRLIGGDASESTIQECLNYGRPLVLFTFVFMLIGVMSSILRSEGAAKRSMYILIIAALINVVLDPFFIYDYGLGWGMTGAALATILAESVALSVMFYWYFVKKDLFLKFRFRGFRFEKEIIKDIFKVGIPASAEMIIMSVVMMVTNIILLMAGGDDAVAIYSSDWRLINVLAIPMMGIASGIVPVCAAAFGAGRADKIRVALNYSSKISCLSMIVISTVAMIFAPQILYVFTYGPDTEYLREGMVEFLRVACLFLPFMAFSYIGVSFFQALGMGMKSLVAMIFMSFIMVPSCYIIMLTTEGMTLIWWTMAASEIIGSLFIVFWSRSTLKKVERNMEMSISHNIG